MFTQLKAVQRVLVLLSFALLVSFGTAVHGQEIPELKITRLEARVQPKEWSRFSFGDPVLFSANFPGVPLQLQQRTPGNDGSSTTWLFQTGNSTAAYQLAWSRDEGSAPDSALEKAKVFNNFAGGFFDGLVKTGKVKDGKVVEERAIKVRGLDAYERDFSFADHEARLRVFFIGKFRLAVVCIWNSDNPPNERNAFFNSVKLELTNIASQSSP